MEFTDDFNNNFDLTNDTYLELVNFVSTLFNSSNLMTPNLIHEKIINELWKNINTSEEYPIDFKQANHLDETFFGKGGTFWLDAFGRPDENSVFVHESKNYIAKNCGIFTFDLTSVDEFDSSNIDDLESTIIYPQITDLISDTNADSECDNTASSVLDTAFIEDSSQIEIIDIEPEEDYVNRFQSNE